jgi:hypothetical protein
MRSIVIGGASGFWGEAPHATAQLLAGASLDFIVYDYLAEITMSILARARAKDPAAGFVPDFVNAALAPNIAEIARRGIRIVSNAGGLNPEACAEAVRRLVRDRGLGLKVAAVTGDDLIAGVERFADAHEMFTDQPFPPVERIQSANAYLGAFPIAAALDAGADIVITGRCVDSAVTLGAAIHAFGWRAGQYDLLSAGSLAGHLIECGPQVTGGNFTDWRRAGDIADIGYPLATVFEDGSVEIRKPEGTSGIVCRESVGEQMLYEIGDPQAYLLPDLTCDFSAVTIEETGHDVVLVRGARGRPPSGMLKVCATWTDGFRAGQQFDFTGFDAREKATAFGEAALARARRILGTLKAPDYDAVNLEVTGRDGDYGEAVLTLGVRHRDERAVGLFLREATGLALATPAGMSVFAAGGRPRPSPVVRLFSFLVPAASVRISVSIDGAEIAYPPAPVAAAAPAPQRPPEPVQPDLPEDVEVLLIRLAVARSGDKGDTANIGVIARRAEYLPLIWAALTPQRVREHFAGRMEGDVERYLLPGCHALNLVLEQSLGGGGVTSLRADPQGKAYAQHLLAVPVKVTREIAAEVGA